MSIKKLLPKKQELSLFQAAIPKELYVRLIDKLKKDKVKRRAFMVACAKHYLKEK